MRELVESGLKRASAALPGAERTTVCIQPVALNRAIEHMRGVGGVSLGGRIKIFVHPTIAGFARVEYTAAHEYHHEVARMHLEPGWSHDPLESMIAEGKADAFAVRLFPPSVRRTRTALLRTKDSGHGRRFSNSSRRPPTRSAKTSCSALPTECRDGPGYRLGFEMVNGYLETHPDLPVKAWTLLPAREFLEAFRAGRRRSD